MNNCADAVPPHAPRMHPDFSRGTHHAAAFSLPAMRLLSILLFLLVSIPGALASDWPRFLGPQGDATSPETGLLDSFPPAGPPVVWSLSIGTGYSAPSVRGDRLVLHHRLGDEEIVECLDAATGQPRWKHAYPTRYVDPYGYNNGPRCTPLLTTNRCYTFGAEGKLVCVELETGKLVWQRDTARDWQIPEAFFGVGSTPLLEGGLLIVMLGAQPNAGVVALDPDTGKTVWESVGEKNWAGQPMIGWPGDRTVVWKKADKQASYASPVAATIHGKRHLFCLMRQGLVSLDPKTGGVNFSRWFRAQVEESVNSMNPVVQGDLVFCSAAYHSVGGFVLRILPDGKSFEEVWRSPPAGQRDVEPVLEIHWMTPVLHDGHLFAFSGRNPPDASFRCVELATGALKWKRREVFLDKQMLQRVYGRGSLILADGKLIALGEGGLLGLFRPNTKECEEISRWQVPGLRYPCWAAPVLAHQKLYLRSEDRLVCLDFAAKEPARQP
jgi:outer membrane protein assembly factor BamB